MLDPLNQEDFRSIISAPFRVQYIPELTYIRYDRFTKSLLKPCLPFILMNLVMLYNVDPSLQESFHSFVVFNGYPSQNYQKSFRECLVPYLSFKTYTPHGVRGFFPSDNHLSQESQGMYVSNIIGGPVDYLSEYVYNQVIAKRKSLECKKKLLFYIHSALLHQVVEVLLTVGVQPQFHKYLKKHHRNLWKIN